MYLHTSMAKCAMALQTNKTNFLQSIYRTDCYHSDPGFSTHNYTNRDKYEQSLEFVIKARIL